MFNRILRLVLILTFAGTWAGLSQDVDTEQFKEALSMSFDELLQVKIVTASKAQRASTDITQKFDIIPEKQFNQMVFEKRNLAEIIQSVPGASVKVLSRNDANWGAYGGIGPKYSTYMVQGLPVDAFIDPQSLDILAINHVEIQRGPASVLYPNYLSQDFAGNQSPLAGTVNLILKEKVEKPATLVSLGTGSYATHTVQAYHENRLKRLHLIGGVSFEKSDYSNYGSTDSWLNMLDNPEYQKNKGFISGTYFIDDDEDHKLSFFANLTSHTGNWGRTNRNYDFLYSMANIAYSGQMSEEFTLSVKAGFRGYDRWYESDDYGGSGDLSLINTSGVEQRIIPVDFSLAYNHYNNSNLIVGFDFQSADYLTWDQPVNVSKKTGNDAVVQQIGIYLQEELQLDQFTLRAGGRYNNINYQIESIGGQNAGEDTRSWNVLLWSAGAKYRITEVYSLFINGGNSFMSPSLKSIGGTVPFKNKFVAGMNGQLPNPDLNPERGVGLDFGLDMTLSHNLYLGFRLFSTSVSDAIIDNVISQDPSQTMSINADGQTVARGFEIGLNQDVGNLSWFANMTFTNATLDDPQNPDQDGANVPFVPKTMGNLGVTWFAPLGLVVSPWLHLGGIIYDSSSKANRTEYDSGELINLVVSKPFNLSAEAKVIIFLKLYNLSDNKYEMPWQFQDTGRSITIGARLQR